MCTFSNTPRKPIGARKLSKLVGALLSEWTLAGKEFTAYDVTRALRARHPDLEIVHPAVRRVVWSGMAGCPGYDVEARDYGSSLANTWYAVPAPFFRIGGLIVWKN